MKVRGGCGGLLMYVIHVCLAMNRGCERPFGKQNAMSGFSRTRSVGGNVASYIIPEVETRVKRAFSKQQKIPVQPFLYAGDVTDTNEVSLLELTVPYLDEGDVSYVYRNEKKVQLGIGATSDVYLGQMKAGGELVAIKEASYTFNHVTQLETVAAIMLYDTGYVPRVFGLIPFGNESRRVAIVVEYVENSVTLSSIYEGTSVNLTLDKFFIICKQMAYGLKRLHAKQFVHGDIGGGNILIDLTNNHPRVLFIDFEFVVFKHRQFNDRFNNDGFLTKERIQMIDFQMLGVQYFYIHKKIKKRFLLELYKLCINDIDIDRPADKIDRIIEFIDWYRHCAYNHRATYTSPLLWKDNLIGKAEESKSYIPMLNPKSIDDNHSRSGGFPYIIGEEIAVILGTTIFSKETVIIVTRFSHNRTFIYNEGKMLQRTGELGITPPFYGLSAGRTNGLGYDMIFEYTTGVQPLHVLNNPSSACCSPTTWLKLYMQIAFNVRKLIFNGLYIDQLKADTILFFVKDEICKIYFIAANVEIATDKQFSSASNTENVTSTTRKTMKALCGLLIELVGHHSGEEQLFELVTECVEMYKGSHINKLIKCLWYIYRSLI